MGRSTCLEVRGIYDTPAWGIFRWIDKIRGEGVGTPPPPRHKTASGTSATYIATGTKSRMYWRRALILSVYGFPTVSDRSCLRSGPKSIRWRHPRSADRDATGPASNSLRCDKGRAPALARGCGWVGLAGWPSGLIGGWVLSNGNGMRGNNRSTGRRDLSLPSY